MVGEGPEADEDEGYPRSFKNKTVGQRMIIISAGVIMNVLFGCICFVLVYRYRGVERPPAVIASIDAGSASDLAGNLSPAAGPSATFIVDNTPPDTSPLPHKVLAQPNRHRTGGTVPPGHESIAVRQWPTAS